MTIFVQTHGAGAAAAVPSRACVINGRGWRFRRRLPSERISALNDPEQHDDNRDDQEDVDEASERVGRDDAGQPQDDEDDEQCRKHDVCPFRSPAIIEPDLQRQLFGYAHVYETAAFAQ
jgi:hypothetical protein